MGWDVTIERRVPMGWDGVSRHHMVGWDVICGWYLTGCGQPVAIMVMICFFKDVSVWLPLN